MIEILSYLKGKNVLAKASPMRTYEKFRVERVNESQITLHGHKWRVTIQFTGEVVNININRPRRQCAFLWEDRDAILELFNYANMKLLKPNF